MPPAPVPEAAITNPLPGRGGITSQVTDSTTASGGAWSATARQNSSTSAAAPCTSASTPSASLLTSPDRPSRAARA